MVGSLQHFPGPLALRRRLATHDCIKLTAIVTISIGSAKFYYLCKTLLEAAACMIKRSQITGFWVTKHRKSESKTSFTW